MVKLFAQRDYGLHNMEDLGMFIPKKLSVFGLKAALSFYSSSFHRKEWGSTSNTVSRFDIPSLGLQSPPCFSTMFLQQPRMDKQNTDSRAFRAFSLLATTVGEVRWGVVSWLQFSVPLNPTRWTLTPTALTLVTLRFSLTHHFYFHISYFIFYTMLLMYWLDLGVKQRERPLAVFTVFIPHDSGWTTSQHYGLCCFDIFTSYPGYIPANTGSSSAEQRVEGERLGRGFRGFSVSIICQLSRSPVWLVNDAGKVWEKAKGWF